MADAFSVSVATPADNGPVGALLEASYPALMRDSYDAAVLAAALPAMTKANAALLSSGTYYVARSKAGETVGCGGWTHGRPGSGETEPGPAHIRHFATHPDWTGRGIGRLLYARCEADARAAGARRFECYSSINAEGFYAALGFETVRRMQIPMANGVRIPNVLMQRRI